MLKSISLRQASGAVILGAVAFLIADALEVRYWAWFAGDVPFGPWFLNAGRAALLSAACLFAAGALAGATVRTPLDKALACVSVTAGACAAMTAVLFVRGPGTIFPIVLMLGGGALFACAALGTAASFLVRR